MLEFSYAKEGSVGEGSAWAYAPDSWRENLPFNATIELTGHGRGRSSVRVYGKNVNNGEKYSMAISALYEAIKHFGVQNGEITGKWNFRKQGSNYTLWPLIEK